MSPFVGLVIYFGLVSIAEEHLSRDYKRMTNQRLFIERAFALPRVLTALFFTTLLVLAVAQQQNQFIDSGHAIASAKVERSHSTE